MDSGTQKTKPIRVLLVDDDQDFLEVNRVALENEGFEVLLAHDGDEGKRMALESPVDVVVLDVIMRTRDEGFELARDLRRDKRTCKIPLLMLTSVNAINRSEGLLTFSDRDRDDSWLPVDRFLDKPLRADILVRTIREVLSLNSVA